MIKILFLAANPNDTDQIRFDREHRAIDLVLQQAKFRDEFELIPHSAVRIADLRRYLLRYEPHIVHFSGHGNGNGGEIILETDSGQGQTVPTDTLSQLFSILKGKIRCVFLNSCRSERQAEALSHYIDCVIGTTNDIEDEAAINFAEAFYEALGYGASVRTAFDLGYLNGNIHSQSIAKLFDKNEISSQISFISNEERPSFDIDKHQSKTSHSTRNNVEVIFSKDLYDESPELQEKKINDQVLELTIILRTSREEVVIVNVKRGSTILVLEMPSKTVERLLLLFATKNVELQRLGIRTVKLVADLEHRYALSERFIPHPVSERVKQVVHLTLGGARVMSSEYEEVSDSPQRFDEISLDPVSEQERSVARLTSKQEVRLPSTGGGQPPSSIISNTTNTTIGNPSSKHIVFARVQPKSIKISEKYFYEADAINYFMRVKQEGNKPKEAEGSLEVTVPYDGEKHVTRQTIADIQRQSGRIWRQASATIRIGYLNFANYGRSELEGKSALPIEHDSLPLDLPIKGPDLPPIAHKGQAGELLRDRYRWQLKQKYTPKLPPAPPIKLIIQSYDEAQMAEINRLVTGFFDKLDRAKRDPKNRAPSLNEKQQVIECLTQQEDLQPELTFDIQITLQLAKNISESDANNLPKLDRIAIQWPVAVAADQVILEIGAKKLGSQEEKSPQALYIPAKEGAGVLEWRDVVLQLPKDKELPEKGPYTYTSPHMRLRVKQPGELYKMTMLNGTLEVKTAKFALSDLQVQFFDATGRKSELQTEAESKISVDFIIGLKDYIAGKTLAPYQQLQFAGVMLDKNRLVDIRILFKELGLTTRTEELTGLRYYNYYIIHGEKTHHLGNLKLWLLCEGTPDYADRTTVMPGGQIYNTRVFQGHTKLYLRGYTVGDKTALLEIMNGVQQKLKAMFQYVKMLD